MIHHITARRLPRVLAALVAGLLLLLGLRAPTYAEAPSPDKAAARYEVDFMTTMIDHHQMAIDMSQICLDKVAHPELRSMCKQIIAAQSQEITTMQSWLQDWYGVSHSPSMSTGNMKSMSRLQDLQGADFEITFMRTMTRHHWAAVREAGKCVENAYHKELVSLCDGIVSGQLAEIRQLNTWLCQWYDRCGGWPTETA